MDRDDMTRTHSLRSIVYGTCAVLSVAISTPSHASAVISFVQQAGGVVATGSGSIDRTDLFPSFSGNDGFTAVSGLNAYAVIGSIPQEFDSVTFESGASGPATFGTSTYITASSGSGDKFGIDAANYSGPGTARIWLPPTYVSGTALSANDTWTGATFASLGLTPGVYTYTWGSGVDADSLQVRIGAAPLGGAPEPETWVMMLLGFGAMGATARRWTRPTFAGL
jgi:hypothetical protein